VRQHLRPRADGRREMAGEKEGFGAVEMVGKLMKCAAAPFFID
jgi:hypothetical protein